MITEDKDERGRPIFRVGEKWFYSREKAEAIAGKAPKPAPKSAPKSAGTPQPDRFPILAGACVQTSEGPRPVAIVEVAPGKRRAFYMSLGKGGQTPQGAWNLFGGITADDWFIKPHGGKVVAKYAAVEEALAEGLSRDPVEADKRLSRLAYFIVVTSYPTAILAERRALLAEYENLENQKWSRDAKKHPNLRDEWNSPEYLKRRAHLEERQKEIGARLQELKKYRDDTYRIVLNRFLEKFGAIAPLEKNDAEQVVAGFRTVRAVPRAKNPE